MSLWRLKTASTAMTWGLVALMTEDHCFVDGLGQVVHGREQMEKGWLSYFSWFPN